MKKPIKKSLKKQKIQSDSTTDELIKSNIKLFQLCNELSNRVFSTEIATQKLASKMQGLEKDNMELRKVLDLIGEKIKEIKDDMIGPDDDQDTPDQNTSVSPAKNIPLHDDVTVMCSVCDKVFHSSLKKCPNCGFNRKESR
jgi:hypothetical protein